MMFEFSQDLIPVLLTVSLYMTFAGAHLIQYMAHESSAANRSMTQKQLHSWRNLNVPESMQLDHHIDRHAWITRIMKRKEGPEDDSDNLSFSNSVITKLRGGFMWKKSLYSPNFQNIAR
ncbi:hypothetical protein [Salipaludibacillus daqingensis]|uniref:hypothetical protein n=1 Tax=Salipaludibacillus daqingensis TaxID=3041001 RepID=UPI0024757AAE|nr:hypothetical protein [Salipaludibacillus daqingensis]